MWKDIKIAVLYAIFFMLILNIIGCATARGGKKLPEIQQLQTRINELEKQVQDKEEEIYDLEDEIGRIKVTKAAKPAKRIISAKNKTSARTLKNIQIALKNTGFYKGSIDGKIGRGTRKAIRDFQKANGLAVDGVVGKKTWALLENSLSG